MSSPDDKIGIVVLAAGISSRLGSPKQLLSYKGKTLLRHAVDEAVNSSADFVVVVLGANAESCLNEIESSKAVVVENKEWKKGMASSLITGLKTLLERGVSVDGVIFMVCDQPFVSAVVLDNLIKTYKETGKSIVASNYGEAIGPPAFFHQSFFTKLMQLKGDEGAKKIIQQHKEEAATILFPQGRVDIDRKEDYEKLIKT
ncbi:MAG: NTP transferase domain-containing protein [Chitinophagales bacterium]